MEAIAQAARRHQYGSLFSTDSDTAQCQHFPPLISASAWTVLLLRSRCCTLLHTAPHTINQSDQPGCALPYCGRRIK